MGWLQLTQATAQTFGIAGLEEARQHLRDDQIRHAVKSGRLESIFPAAYRIAGAPSSWEQRVYAACLATGGVASHRSAARLWGIAHVPAERLELTVPPDQVVRLPGVVAHRSNRLPESHITSFAGIPVTSGARTIVDLSAVLGDRTLERAVNDALRRSVATVDELLDSFAALAGRGRRRVAHLRPLLEARASGFDPGGSDAELQIVEWLVGAGLPRPVQQLWVAAGGKRYRLDYAFPAPKVGLEYDGWDDHGTRLAFDYDRERRDELELAGWLMLQFTSRTSRRAVVDRVRRALEQRLSPELRALEGA